MDLFQVTPEERILIENFMGTDYHFSKDFNGLMPVVEKIVETKYVDFFLTISSLKGDPHASVYIGTASDEYGGSKNESTIEAVYKAVVEFIKFYNEQNETPKP